VAPPLTVAVPKGRSQKPIAAILRKAGIDDGPLTIEDRRLVRLTEDGSLGFLLLKPDDVPTYVEYGAADVGICGRDVLLERRYSLYEPLDLGIGKCRMVVAGREGHAIPDVPRVATKFTRIASEHFAKKGVTAEVIYVGGSVELAPLVGLADLIVDLVETGETLRENHLAVFETIAEISTVVVANRASFKLRAREMTDFLTRLERAITST
jgi:ATP phosphoribosyltransferase